MVKLTDNIVYGRTKSTPESVRKLNLWGCEIDDISLCANMPNLEILSMSVNRVEDLQPLKQCHNLQELYLRKNEISDLNQLEYLRNLDHLTVLWLDENPCADSCSYRRKVLKVLPQLTMLDNKAVTQEELARAQLPSPPSSVIYHNTDVDITTSDLERLHVYNSHYTPHCVTSCTVYEETTPVNEEPTAASSSTLSMSTSLIAPANYGVYGLADTQSDWNQEFPLDSAREGVMSQSVSGSLPSSSQLETITKRHQYLHDWTLSTKRPASSSRSRSESPLAQRQDNILAAVGVLMDELDQRGLRAVVEEAQRRMKKRR